MKQPSCRHIGCNYPESECAGNCCQIEEFNYEEEELSGMRMLATVILCLFCFFLGGAIAAFIFYIN